MTSIPETKKADVETEQRNVVFSSLLSPAAKTDISEVVDTLWKTLKPEVQKVASDASSKQDIKYDAYRETRRQLRKAATLATICDHSTRLEIIEHWGALQDAYLQRTLKQMPKKIRDMEDYIELHKQEIEKLSADEKTFKEMWAELSGKLPTDTQMRKLNELRPKLETLGKYKKEYEGYTRAISSWEQIVAELKQTSSASVFDKINYVVLSPDEIIEKLKEGPYTGLPVERFEVQRTNGTIAARTDTQSAPPKAVFASTKERPAELTALLELKNLVDSYAQGTKFDASKTRKNLPDEYLFSAGIIGSYLRTCPDLFGITHKTKGTTHFYVKEDQLPKGEEEFLNLVIERLRAPDNAAVNKFYIQRALARIREDPKISYGLFGIAEVQAKIKEDGVNLSSKPIAVNLGKLAAEYGVEVVANVVTLEKRYQLAKVQVTDKHRESIRSTMPEMGYRFGSSDLSLKITEKGKDPVHPRVIDTLFEKEAKSFGVRCVAKGVYETAKRPESATELHNAAEKQADMDSLV